MIKVQIINLYIIKKEDKVYLKEPSTVTPDFTLSLS